MKMFVLALRDRQLNGFSRPIFVPAIGMGVRSFVDEVNREDPTNPVWSHPEDYELFHIGMWDEESGLFECQVPAVSVAIASNMRRRVLT